MFEFLLWIAWVIFCYFVGKRIIEENERLANSNYPTLWGVAIVIFSILPPWFPGMILFVVWLLVKKPDFFRTFPELEGFRKKKE